MHPPGQVVRLTRAEGVHGYPGLLCHALDSQGMPWYPEYTVYEEYRPYGQGQFFCKVRILNFEGDQVQFIAAGIGMTVEQSVHEAAYHALTCFREDWPDFNDEDSPFRYFPAAAEGREGVFRPTCMSAADHPDPMVRCLVRMLNATVRRAHLWREYAVASRMSHWDTLMDIEPYVNSGALPQSFLDPTPIELPLYMAPPVVGGTVPPRGPIRTPLVDGGLHQSPYGRQPASAYRFRTRRVLIPPAVGSYP